MSRAKRAGDTARNARRRFVRQGKRYLQQAEQAVGATKSRYLTLAGDMLQKAVSLYSEDFDKSKAEKPIRELAKALNIDISNVSPTANKLEGVAQSYEALVNVPKKTGLRKRREREAKSLLKIPNVKNRLYAGTIDIWEDVAPDDREQAILDAFGAETMLDVLDTLENAGIDLYTPSPVDEMYETARLQVVRYVQTKLEV